MLVKPSQILALVALISHSALADWTLEAWTCASCCDVNANPSGWSDYTASPHSQGSCGGYGSDAPYGDFFSSQNPCGGGQTLNYYATGNGEYDVYISGGDGSVKGHCYQGDHSLGTCQDWNYSCSVSQQVFCYSSICN